MINRYCNYCGYHHSKGRHLVEHVASDLGITRSGVYWWLSVLSIFGVVGFSLIQIFTGNLLNLSQTASVLEFSVSNLVFMFGVLMLMHAFHEDMISERNQNETCRTWPWRGDGHNWLSQTIPSFRIW